MTLADTPTATTPSSQRERILDGALRCIGRWGLAKTTLDDLAREAGCSRATVYRLFPGGKDSVIDAVIATEVGRFFAGLAGRLDGIDDLDELVVAGVSHAARTLSEHRALQYLLAHEPELLLPRISFHHLDQILAAVSDFLVPYLAPHVGATEAVRAGEWLARITLSYALCPSDAVDLRDPDSARRFCRTYVLAGLAAPVPQ